MPVRLFHLLISNGGLGFENDAPATRVKYSLDRFVKMKGIWKSRNFGVQLKHNSLIHDDVTLRITSATDDLR